MVVVHEDARVEHGDPAGQADPLEQVRPWLGNDHVTGDDGHRTLELWKGTRHPGVYRQHDPVAGHVAVRRVDGGGQPLFQAGHGRAFVDPYPQFQRHPAQAAHQLARLHTGCRRREPAFEVSARTRHSLRVSQRAFGERVDAIALQRGDHGVGRAELGAVGCRVKRAIESVIGIHRVLVAKAADGVDALLRFLDQAYGLLDAEQTLQGEVLGRPGQRAAAIAPTGTGAADVGFDDDHVQLGILFLEHDGGP
ncbi:hypothetical protein D3C76_502910 [compost metagenome]